jgi:SPW repeat
MRAEMSLPRQWEDWASWVFGIWLCISPWALEFDLQSVPTRNAVIVGALIILAEVVTLSIFRPWEEWINVVLGAWLIVSPWALGVASAAAKANFVVVGALVVALALYEMRSVEGEA